MAAISGRQYPIVQGDQQVVVAEVGAGLRRYQVDGVDVTCSYGEDELAPKCCGATLMPWPNRVRGGRYRFDDTDQQLALTEPAAGNAIHGLGRWARWQPAEQYADAVTLSLDVVPQNGYPFAVHLRAGYRLGPDGLTVTLSACNTGSVRVPFGAGSHPYLSTRGHSLTDTTLQLPADRHLDLDAAQIPVGSSPVAGATDFRDGRPLGNVRLDDGFTGLQVRHGRGAAEVRTVDGGARLWFDAAFGYLQVFTRENVTPGRHGVAVEPMTCAPDAFNSGDGLIVLDPGERWSASWGITPL